MNHQLSFSKAVPGPTTDEFNEPLISQKNTIALPAIIDKTHAFVSAMLTFADLPTAYNVDTHVAVGQNSSIKVTFKVFTNNGALYLCLNNSLLESFSNSIGLAYKHALYLQDMSNIPVHVLNVEVPLKELYNHVINLIHALDNNAEILSFDGACKAAKSIMKYQKEMTHQIENKLNYGYS